MSNVTVLNQEFYKPIKADFEKLVDIKTFKKEVNFAIQLLTKNPYLQKCDQGSILTSVLNVSQTGLTLNPVLNYAYLVPHKGKCVLYPSYQGLCKLATDTGSVRSIEAVIINEGDDIEMDLSSDEKVKSHKPYLFTGKPQGKILGAYSIATLDNGQKLIELMSIEQIHDIRKHSESYKSYLAKKISTCVWVDNPSEMCRKTVVKRHFKYLPKSHVPESMQKAIELDNSDYDFPMSYGQGNMIEGLLMSCAIPEKAERQIYSALQKGDMTQGQANDCIEYLQQNQRDAISSGASYSQTDIKNKLKKEK